MNMVKACPVCLDDEVQAKDLIQVPCGHKDWSEKNGTDIFVYCLGSIIGTVHYCTNFKNIDSER